LSAILIVVCFTQCTRFKSGIYNKSLPNLKDVNVNLEILKENKVNVFIAFANDCPVCKSCIPTLREIVKSYPEVGVVLFYPNNPLDTVVNDFIKSMLPKKILLIKDKNKYLTQKLKAELTPEVFVLDTNENIIYSGAVDNSVFTNYRKSYSQKNSFLLNALDTIVRQNKPIINNETKAVGCYIE
jgi:thiol-disulfide isomerase/thioredoxin